MLFNQLNVQPLEGGRKSLDLKFDVGRTLGLMLIGAIALVGMIVLYAMDKGTGATACLSVAEAILVGGFGIQLGERAGAKAAESELMK